MPIRDFMSQRLFVDAALREGERIEATAEQANYLRTVLRSPDGAQLLVFNGRDGEWRVRVEHVGKRGVALVPEHMTRAQEQGPDIHWLFAPLKRARLDYMVQKAVELGVARVVPVMTRHTQAERVNLERLRANIIEAAEQCGVLRVPGHDAPRSLDALLDAWDPARRLIVADEAADVADPLAALGGIARGTPVALLIGPEGGFAAEERARLARVPGLVRLSLGPRIMRADTAAVAALAIINATIGDWR